jgi:hypothetical protein
MQCFGGSGLVSGIQKHEEFSVSKVDGQQVSNLDRTALSAVCLNPNSVKYL